LSVMACFRQLISTVEISTVENRGAPWLDSDHVSPDHVESLLDAKPFILTLDDAREHTLR
jgi:hypothetical protein